MATAYEFVKNNSVMNRIVVIVVLKVLFLLSFLVIIPAQRPVFLSTYCSFSWTSIRIKNVEEGKLFHDYHYRFNLSPESTIQFIIWININVWQIAGLLLSCLIIKKKKEICSDWFNSWITVFTCRSLREVSSHHLWPRWPRPWKTSTAQMKSVTRLPTQTPVLSRRRTLWPLHTGTSQYHDALGVTSPQS